MLKSSLKEEVTFINSKFKLRFVGKFFWKIVLIALLCSSAFLLSSGSHLEGNYTSILQNIHYFDLNLQYLIFYIALPTLFISTIYVWIFTLRKSNKIAGPAYRIEKTLKNMGEGDFTVHTSFRKDDAVKKIPEDFNEVFENISSVLWEFNQNLSKVKKEIDTLKMEDTSPPERLIEVIKDARNSLARFKTEQ